MDKRQVIVGVLLLVGAFASGRFMAPAKVKTEEKIVYVEKTEKSKQTDTDKKKHVTTIKTEETRPDGTKFVTTKTEENTDTNRSSTTKENTEKSKTEERSKLVESGAGKVNLSALGGLDVFNLTKPPVFGAHATKAFLGPFTLGVWGLSNGTGGLSLGLQL